MALVFHLATAAAQVLQRLYAVVSETILCWPWACVEAKGMSELFWQHHLTCNHLYSHHHPSSQIDWLFKPLHD